MEIDKDLDNLLLDLDILGVQEIIKFDASCSSDEQYQKERNSCIKWNDSSDGLRILSTVGSIDLIGCVNYSEDYIPDFSYINYSLFFKRCHIKFRAKNTGTWTSNFGKDLLDHYKNKERKYSITLLCNPHNPDNDYSNKDKKNKIEFTIMENDLLEAFSYYGNVTEAVMEIAEYKIGGWLRNRGGRKGEGLGKLLKRYVNG